MLLERAPANLGALAEEYQFEVRLFFLGWCKWGNLVEGGGSRHEFVNLLVVVEMIGCNVNLAFRNQCLFYRLEKRVME
jgi:hypothetical protein